MQKKPSKRVKLPAAKRCKYISASLSPETYAALVAEVRKRETLKSRLLEEALRVYLGL